MERRLAAILAVDAVGYSRANHSGHSAEKRGRPSPPGNPPPYSVGPIAGYLTY